MKKYKTLWIAISTAIVLIAAFVQFDLFGKLEKGVDWFVFDLLKLPETSKLVSALNFFLYDSIKILFLVSN